VICCWEQIITIPATQEAGQVTKSERALSLGDMTLDDQKFHVPKEVEYYFFEHLDPLNFTDTIG